MSQIKIDQIIRSSRRTLSLEIAPDASLVVRAPRHVKMDAIENVIFRKRFWIQSKQKLIQKKRSEIHPKQFVNGEGFLYLGRMYQLQIVEDAVPLCFQECFYLSKGHGRQAFIKWYKERALEKIFERVEWYAKAAGLEYKSINLSNAAKRWGSCSGKDKLRFNWRLIMAPLEVIDYVAAHELAHLKEKNHTRAFWGKVGSILPGYKKSAVWLKENQHLLTI
jgi:hypothetical protein